jgi:nucleotide sugar dehydrogenase
MSARIAVVGSGYVGTVAAACFAHVGHRVVGLETDAGKLASLRAGRAPFFEAGLDELLAEGMAAGRLWFTDDVADAMASSDVVFLCVGTPSGVDGRPDMSAVEAASRAMGEVATDHHVLVTKSTVPIGSGQWLSTIIEDAVPPGRRDLDLFSVVSNPEFLREGTAVSDFLHPDRIVIGSDDGHALDVVAEVYRPIVEQTFATGNGHKPPLVRTTRTTAETIKYANNAFLATKISFINELATICELFGADVGDVAHAVGLDARIGRGFLDAGIGWGGSCFGKDLRALIATAAEYGYEPELLRASIAVNARQRCVVVEKLQRHVKNLRGARIGLLGLAFKPGTDDLRDAPALDIAERLLLAGSVVTAHDPVVTALPDHGGVRIVDDPLAVADRADAVVLVTDWPEYRWLDLAEVACRMRGNILVDGRNLFDRDAVAQVGLRYDGYGRGPARTRRREQEPVS